MRAKIHKFLQTKSLKIEDTKALNQKSRAIILTELNKNLPKVE